jgi:hypothetical protein
MYTFFILLLRGNDLRLEYSFFTKQFSNLNLKYHEA